MRRDRSLGPPRRRQQIVRSDEHVPRPASSERARRLPVRKDDDERRREAVEQRRRAALPLSNRRSASGSRLAAASAACGPLGSSGSAARSRALRAALRGCPQIQSAIGRRTRQSAVARRQAAIAGGSPAIAEARVPQLGVRQRFAVHIERRPIRHGLGRLEESRVEKLRAALATEAAGCREGTPCSPAMTVSGTVTAPRGPAAGRPQSVRGGTFRVTTDPAWITDSFANRHVRQDHAVRTDEHVAIDDHPPIADRLARSPVEMRDDGRPNADRAVVANRQRLRMHIVDVDVQPDPDVGANLRTPPPMQARPDARATGTGSWPADEAHCRTSDASARRFSSRRSGGLRQDVADTGRPRASHTRVVARCASGPSIRHDSPSADDASSADGSATSG